MTVCIQDDWISGMWHIFAGFVVSMAGVISLLAVAPLFKDEER